MRPDHDVEQLRQRVHVDVVAALLEQISMLQAEVARDHVRLSGDDQTQAIRVVERPRVGQQIRLAVVIVQSPHRLEDAARDQVYSTTKAAVAALVERGLQPATAQWSR